MTAVIVLFFVKIIDLVVVSVGFVQVSSNCRYKVVPSWKRRRVLSAGCTRKCDGYYAMQYNPACYN